MGCGKRIKSRVLIHGLCADCRYIELRQEMDSETE